MQEIKKRVIDTCQSEIDMAKYYIGFYKYQESKENKKDAANTKLKRLQIEKALKTNELMLKRLEEYNATI